MILWHDPQSALRVTEILSGGGSALASFEFLSLRREFGSRGLFSFGRFSARYFVLLCSVRLFLALWLALFPAPAFLNSARLVALVLLTMLSVRFMPLGLEAADQMLSILLAAQMLASFAPGNPQVQKTSLWFIALQSALAYSVAGWAKLLKPAWRDGSYLRGLLNTEIFGHPYAARLISRPAVASFLSLALIALECAFPLSLLMGAGGAASFCFFVLLMHLVNAYVLGLNLFVWAFAATYPALIYCASGLWQ